METPSKVRSRPAGRMQVSAFFCNRSYRRCRIINEPKFYLREYESRKNSGIRFGKRTEGGVSDARFRGAAYFT